ncbi:MAG: ATP-binding cassette domain-containing protein [Granulosicoccus sp.]|nr:ATP-binding cassette domain-containing protein [Granulosicoccus sp.]
MSNSDCPAIACDGLWQVFGENANTLVRQLLATHGADVEAAAESLREHNCVPAVQDVNFELQRGELFVIMGLSGSGKSTLIRSLSGLISASAGSVEIDGENITQASKQRMIELRREKLGMVFQHFGLFPHMSVLQNVCFPLKMKGEEKSSREQRALEIIELVGLKGKESAYPRQLSGGQQQRVGLARSLSVNPDIWFLDEPFSALDPLIRRQLQDEFLRIQRTLKKSIIFITHDIAEALKLADRIALLRDGRIVQIGSPTDIVLRPANDYVRDFTADVARGQHATVATLMDTREPLMADASVTGDPGLLDSMTIDAALARCASMHEKVPVRDEHGRLVGTVNPGDLATALHSESS